MSGESGGDDDEAVNESNGKGDRRAWRCDCEQGKRRRHYSRAERPQRNGREPAARDPPHLPWTGRLAMPSVVSPVGAAPQFLQSRDTGVQAGPLRSPRNAPGMCCFMRSVEACAAPTIVL
ncbi:hypothetical protein MBLNU459_g6314t1 [Dothideomycetes sp. NU459]